MITTLGSNMLPLCLVRTDLLTMYTGIYCLSSGQRSIHMNGLNRHKQSTTFMCGTVHRYPIHASMRAAWNSIGYTVCTVIYALTFSRRSSARLGIRRLIMRQLHALSLTACGCSPSSVGDETPTHECSSAMCRDPLPLSSQVRISIGSEKYVRLSGKRVTLITTLFLERSRIPGSLQRCCDASIHGLLKYHHYRAKYVLSLRCKHQTEHFKYFLTYFKKPTLLVVMLRRCIEIVILGLIALSLCFCSFCHAFMYSVDRENARAEHTDWAALPTRSVGPQSGCASQRPAGKLSCRY
jgi:hypothetical protein